MKTPTPDDPSVIYLDREKPAGERCAAWRFGDFLFCRSMGLLYRDGRTAHLTPKACEVLETLLGAAPEVVRKLHILDEVWPRQDISDAAVTDAVRAIRRALKSLGDTTALGTVRKVGYRISLDAQPIPFAEFESQTGSVRQRASGWSKRWTVATAVLAAGLVALTAVWFAPNPQSDSHAAGVPDYYQRGRLFYERYRNEDNERAISVFEAGLAEYPGAPLLQSGLAEALIQRHDAYGQARIWAERGMEVARMAVSRDPALANGHRAVGLAAASLGQRDLARRSYQRAIELDPDNRQAIGNLAYLLFNQGLVDQALPLFERGLSLDRSSARAHLFIAICYRDVGLFTLADQWFDRAMKLELSADADRSEVLENLIFQGRLAEAEQLVRDGLTQVSPGLRMAWRAWIVALAGRMPEAEAFFARAWQQVDPGLQAFVAIRWYPILDNPERRDELALVIEQAIRRGEQVLATAPRANAGVEHELAMAHAALGRSGQAALWLNQAMASGWIRYHRTSIEPAIQRDLLGDTEDESLAQALALVRDRQTLVRERILASLD